VAVSLSADAAGELTDLHGGRKVDGPSRGVLAIAVSLLFALGSGAVCAKTIGGALAKAYQGGNQTASPNALRCGPPNRTCPKRAPSRASRRKSDTGAAEHGRLMRPAGTASLYPQSPTVNEKRDLNGARVALESIRMAGRDRRLGPIHHMSARITLIEKMLPLQHGVP
jgi:hypothetical protein